MIPEEPHSTFRDRPFFFSFCTPHASSGREQDSMEGQPDAESNKRRRDSQGNWLPAGPGATIMAGTGQSIKNVQGITAAIKVYDGGVVSGDLTLMNNERVLIATCKQLVWSTRTGRNMSI